MATEILTDRLRLRDWRDDPAEVDALHAVLSDPETMKLWPFLFDRDGCAEWITHARATYNAHGYGRWALELRETGQVIGDCGLNPNVIGDWSYIDIGWILHADHHGKGYATEAAGAIVDHAFGTLGLTELVAHMAEEHEASRRVAERLGMVFFRSQPYEKNLGKTHTFFRLTPEMWRAAQ